jgi:hypothetical protein
MICCLMQVCSRKISKDDKSFREYSIYSIAFSIKLLSVISLLIVKLINLPKIIEFNLIDDSIQKDLSKITHKREYDATKKATTQWSFQNAVKEDVHRNINIGKQSQPS